MEILNNLLNSLEYQKNIKVEKVLIGLFWTSVISKNCGLASSFIRKGGPLRDTIKDVGHLSEKTALELASYSRSDSLIEAAIGMAAINSLIDIDEKYCKDCNAIQIILEKAKNKNCAIIGHFPFVDKLKNSVKNLWVIEKKPQQGDYREDDMEDILPHCDVVGITGTTFINHTLEKILPLCNKKSFKVMIGPTTPLSPLLFDYGIDVLSGSKVTSTEKVNHYISQGATFRELKNQGVKLLSMIKK